MQFACLSIKNWFFEYLSTIAKVTAYQSFWLRLSDFLQKMWFSLIAWINLKIKLSTLIVVEYQTLLNLLGNTKEKVLIKSFNFWPKKTENRKFSCQVLILFMESKCKQVLSQNFSTRLTNLHMQYLFGSVIKLSLESWRKYSESWIVVFEPEKLES